jgi:DNA-damage-inducible protein D
MSDYQTESESVSPSGSPFERIRHTTEEGDEYWSARDLAKILDYTDYRNFVKVIRKAEVACTNSGQSVEDHFVDVNEMVEIGSGAQRKIADVHLSRYACYLVIQNSDPSKEIVALGQTYFAVQTRRQEQADELAGPTEEQKRLYLRGQLVSHNRQLADTAYRAGVVQSMDFAIFQDHGYAGLYGGLRARDIHHRKGLKKSQQILDHMGSEELAANLFRATQTEAKLRREQVVGKEKANHAHYEVGRKVRQTIEELGGTMPEELPTPSESIKQLRRKEQKRLSHSQQPLLIPAPDTTTEE